MIVNVHEIGGFAIYFFAADTNGNAATTIREVLRLEWPADEKPTREQARGIAAKNRQAVISAKRAFRKAAQFHARMAELNKAST